MPSTISFLPAAAPAPSSAPSNPSAAQSSADSGASFDSALNQASPAPARSGSRPAVSGSARAEIAAEKAALADAAKKNTDTKDTDASADTDKQLLDPKELAELLTFIGAPVPLQQPPPPEVPADFSIAGDTRSPDSADVHVECEADFAAPQFTAGKDRETFVPDAVGAQKTDTAAVFTLDSASAEAGLTARDLLKQGAEVIDYQLQAQSAETTSAASAATASEQPQPTFAGAAEKAPAAAPRTESAPEAAGVAPSEQTAAASSAATVPVENAAERRSTAPKAPAKGASEKIAAFAAPRVSPAVSGGISSISSEKYNFLNVGNKEVASEVPPVGTGAANWGDSMNQDSRSTPFVARLIDGALSLLGTSQTGAATIERPFEPAPAGTVTATQAAQLVSEIRDIADGLWAVERNSVEVRFHFSEHERLSVKVEYRDGVIQTTFRTDSSELRDTIAREWQVQVASASDARPYRVADPVFNTPPADARGFSLGGDASRQQRQAEQSAQNSAHTFATTSGRGSSSTAVAAAPTATFTRPDTAIHLHAFA